ncbi:hypothetical protein D3C86_1746520 [compost metagenome]
MLTYVPGFLGLTERVLLPLQPKLAILTAPLERLLLSAVRAVDVKLEQVGRLFDSLGYLAGAHPLRCGSANRLRVDRTIQSLVAQGDRRTFAFDAFVKVR